METFEAWARAQLADAPVVAGRRLVFGEGDSVSPRICLIGEAPGGQEEAQGRPFVGKAGQNLDRFLAAVGLRREEIWITNTVKVRPTRTSARGTVSNRPPNREELALFTPLLLEELRRLRPEWIVTLGNTALQALLGPDATVGDLHGRETQVTLSGLPRPVRLFPLYHPAAVIYRRELNAVYEADLQALARILA